MLEVLKKNIQVSIYCAGTLFTQNPSKSVHLKKQLWRKIKYPNNPLGSKANISDGQK